MGMNSFKEIFPLSVGPDTMSTISDLTFEFLAKAYSGLITESVIHRHVLLFTDMYNNNHKMTSESPPLIHGP